MSDRAAAYAVVELPPPVGEPQQVEHHHGAGDVLLEVALQIGTARVDSHARKLAIGRVIERVRRRPGGGGSGRWWWPARRTGCRPSSGRRLSPHRAGAASARPAERSRPGGRRAGRRRRTPGRRPDGDRAAGGHPAVGPPVQGDGGGHAGGQCGESGGGGAGAHASVIGRSGSRWHGRRRCVRSRRTSGRRRSPAGRARRSARARGARRTAASRRRAAGWSGARSPSVAAASASSTRWLRGM